MYDDDRAPGLHWLLEHHRGPARLAHQADVVTTRLAGRRVATDWSHALKTGYDLERLAWAAGDVPPGTLPDVVRPGTVLGEVCPAAADATGLPRGTPIVAGMTDGCAAQIAAGALRVGDWTSALGTTLVPKGVSERPIRDGAVYSHRAPGGEWLPGAASSAGAGALVAAFPGRDLDELTRAARAYADTPLLAYPLVGTGERFPFRAPAARAFVLGTPAGDGELFAALLQSLAFTERLCLERLGAGGELTLAGGGAARNADLCQLRADVLGRPVRLVDHGDSAFGMAVLAAAAGGSLTDTSARMVATARRFEPSPARTRQLAARYDEFTAELRRRGWL